MSDVADWKNGPVVRSEKTNMLVKSFSLAKGVLMTEYNVALLQALILYHAPNFLSEDERERASANMFLGTIVNVRPDLLKCVAMEYRCLICSAGHSTNWILRPRKRPLRPNNPHPGGAIYSQRA